MSSRQDRAPGSAPAGEAEYQAYADSVRRTVACLQEQGFATTGPVSSPGGRFLAYTYAANGMGRDEVSLRYARCWLAVEAAGQDRWTRLTDLPESTHRAVVDRLAACGRVADVRPSAPGPDRERWEAPGTETAAPASTACDPALHDAATRARPGSGP